MTNINRSAWVRNFTGGLAALFLASSPLHAGELPAAAAESIELGSFRGVVYYTKEDGGYQVVATIADGETGLPVRFSTVLAEDQSATISVPGKPGEPGAILEISRTGDTLAVAEIGRVSGM